MRYLIAAVLTAASLGACNLTDSRTRVQHPALLRLSADDSVNFAAPDTVQLNTDFSISVTSFGGSCDTKGPTDVLIFPNGTVEFRPFDVTEVRSDRPCPFEVQSFTHTGTLKLSTAGSRTITLWGRDWDGLTTSRVKNVFVK